MRRKFRTTIGPFEYQMMPDEPGAEYTTVHCSGGLCERVFDDDKADPSRNAKAAIADDVRLNGPTEHILDLLIHCGAVTSRNEGRRLCKQNAVSYGGTRVNEWDTIPFFPPLPPEGHIIEVGKHKAYRILPHNCGELLRTP